MNAKKCMAILVMVASLSLDPAQAMNKDFKNFNADEQNLCEENATKTDDFSFEYIDEPGIGNADNLIKLFKYFKEIDPGFTGFGKFLQIASTTFIYIDPWRLDSEQKKLSFFYYFVDRLCASDDAHTLLSNPLPLTVAIAKMIHKHPSLWKTLKTKNCPFSLLLKSHIASFLSCRLKIEDQFRFSSFSDTIPSPEHIFNVTENLIHMNTEKNLLSLFEGKMEDAKDFVEEQKKLIKYQIENIKKYSSAKYPNEFYLDRLQEALEMYENIDYTRTHPVHYTWPQTIYYGLKRHLKGAMEGLGNGISSLWGGAKTIFVTGKNLILERLGRGQNLQDNQNEDVPVLQEHKQDDQKDLLVKIDDLSDQNSPLYSKQPRSTPQVSVQYLSSNDSVFSESQHKPSFKRSNDRKNSASENEISPVLSTKKDR